MVSSAILVQMSGVSWPSEGLRRVASRCRIVLVMASRRLRVAVSRPALLRQAMVIVGVVLGMLVVVVASVALVLSVCVALHRRLGLASCLGRTAGRCHRGGVVVAPALV